MMSIGDADLTDVGDWILDCVARMGSLDSEDRARGGLDTALRALPLDSITLMELLDELNLYYSTELTPVEIYRMSTVRDIAGAVIAGKDN